MSNRKQTGILIPTKSTIYDYDNRIDRTWSLIKKEISKTNQEIIERYDNLMITLSMAKATRHKHLQTILNLTRYLGKDWDDSSSNDIGKLVVEIVRRYANDNGQETYTSYDHKKILKIFYRWFKLGSREFKEVGDPPETKSVKIKTPTDLLSREDLVTENDRERILRACGENQRDRAFIDVHSEAGTRPGEILSLSIKHVVFDEYGAIIKVDGKTGPRPIRLIRSVPNLSSWINTHPMRDNPDAPLWINTSPKKFGEPLSYSASRQMLARRCTIAGLPKRINMKLFRHSEATESANFMTEAQLRKRHGWSNSSKMPARYVHMINADVENAILDHYGIKRKEKQNSIDVPLICHICEVPNAPDSTICSKCGKPLDLKTALSKEEKEKENQESLKNQMDEMKQELEELKYGPIGRKNKYNQSQIDAPDTPEMKLITMGIPLLLELVFPEEKKRDMMREFENSELENRTPNLHKIFGSKQMDAEQIQFLKKFVKESNKKNSSKEIIHATPRLKIKNF